MCFTHMGSSIYLYYRLNWDVVVLGSACELVEGQPSLPCLGPWTLSELHGEAPSILMVAAWAGLSECMYMTAM